jgi:AcrR family transcriptional regulator
VASVVILTLVQCFLGVNPDLSGDRSKVKPVLSADMSSTSLRDRKNSRTRARIAEAALELFLDHGYAETTIDHIAVAADVSRRTVFHHFPTKSAMLFDHLVDRREVAIQRLRERPASEPTLTSLHAVIREMCEQGFDRRLLAQIRAVLDTEPEVAEGQLSYSHHLFQERMIAVLQDRSGKRVSALEVKALTLMANDWLDTASHVYLTENRASLVACFDEVVAVCARAIFNDLEVRP